MTTIYGTKTSEVSYLQILRAEKQHDEDQLEHAQRMLADTQEYATRMQIKRNASAQRYYDYKKEKNL